MVMMAVMIGIIIQVMDDGIFSPSSMFFLSVVGQVIITGTRTINHITPNTSNTDRFLYYSRMPPPTRSECASLRYRLLHHNSLDVHAAGNLFRVQHE